MVLDLVNVKQWILKGSGISRKLVSAGRTLRGLPFLGAERLGVDIVEGPMAPAVQITTTTRDFSSAARIWLASVTQACNLLSHQTERRRCSASGAGRQLPHQVTVLGRIADEYLVQRRTRWERRRRIAMAAR